MKALLSKTQVNTDIRRKWYLPLHAASMTALQFFQNVHTFYFTAPLCAGRAVWLHCFFCRFNLTEEMHVEIFPVIFYEKQPFFFSSHVCSQVVSRHPACISPTCRSHHSSQSPALSLRGGCHLPSVSSTAHRAPRLHFDGTAGRFYFVAVKKRSSNHQHAPTKKHPEEEAGRN